jgi:hypothetical protein
MTWEKKRVLVTVTAYPEKEQKIRPGRLHHRPHRGRGLDSTLPDAFPCIFRTAKTQKIRLD